MLYGAETNRIQPNPTKSNLRYAQRLLEARFFDVLGRPKPATLRPTVMNRSICHGIRGLGLFLLLSGGLSLPGALCAGESGSAVVVVFNTRMPESKQVAEYYAQRRQVPAGQVFGFELPVTETMTRQEYLEQLQQPLLKKLEETRLFTFCTTNKDNPAAPGAEAPRRLLDARIRYAALCYGVPVKILRDTKLVEEGEQNLQAEVRGRNEASVDSQLACLPLAGQKAKWTGPLANPFYGATNQSLLHPTNGVLMVARLDGPSAAIARGLVDKAIEAETNGLWGRAYFDARGLTNGAAKAGDDWMRQAAAASKSGGFETVLDEAPETFPASFPMSQIAFYAGWYDWNVSGPFTRPKVEFMPGAFAYHLHSFSAQVLRTTSQNWVGPLLAKGATATIGYVDEPFLGGTLDVPVFFSRWAFLRFTYAAAAYAGLNTVSWQAIVVGDPLYRPFDKEAALLHTELERRQDPLAAWSYVRVVNQELAAGADLADGIGFLEQLPLTKRSAVLREKLAELYWARKKLSDAMDQEELALKLDPSPQQKIRLLLTLAQRRTIYGADQSAFDCYQKLLQECPDYPDPLGIYQKLLPLAQKLGKKEEAARCEREIKRLTPPPAPAAAAPKS